MLGKNLVPIRLASFNFLAVFQWILKDSFLLDPRLCRRGPIKSVPSVRPSVRQSVCPSVRDAFFSGTTEHNFLIFWMKVKDHNWKKVTKPDFWNFSPVSRNLGKWGKFGPKMTFFVYFSNPSHYFGIFLFLLLYYISYLVMTMLNVLRDQSIAFNFG